MSDWRKPVVVALLALLLHAALMTAYLAAPRCGGDLSALVCVDRERLNQPPFRYVRVGFPDGGYDGQAYYVIAQDPWRRHDAAYIDKPAYRHLRLLYSALCWFLSAGDPEVLFRTMPAVNLLAIAGLAGLGAAFAASMRRSAWWGLLLPFAVNAGMPALRDLTDSLSTFTVLILMIGWLRRWNPAWLGVAALLALFAREQNLAVVALLALLTFCERDWRRGIALILPALAWASWAALLWRVYDDSPFALGNFGPPMAGMLTRFASPTGRSTTLPVHAVALTCLAIELLACLVIVPPFRPERSSLLLGFAGVALAVLGSSAIFDDLHAYLRVFAWVPLSLWLWAVQSGRRWPFILTLPLAPWPVLAVIQVWR
jgi:hypothetical protein